MINVTKYFERLLNEKVHLSEFHYFIKEVTGYDPEMLKYLKGDLEAFIDKIERANNEPNLPIIVLLKEIEYQISEAKNQSEDKARLLSPIEKITLVEEIYERPEVDTYEEAIKIAEKEAGQYIYKNYGAFKKARYDYKEYL